MSEDVAMGRPELIVTGPYPENDMRALAQDYHLHLLWEAGDRLAYLKRVGAAVRGIATRGDLGAGAALMDACPKLEIIACFGVGVDGIDLDHARARGIRVTNTPDVLTDDVADMGLALLLATAREIPRGDAYVRTGKWASDQMELTRRFNGKRLGIVGLGRIGRAVAKRAAGFNMEIAYTDPVQASDVPYVWHPDVVSLADAVDFLILCAAGGGGTAQLINAAVLKALGTDGILVNIARGNIVDEAALLHALASGGIAGAGLDVFAHEPSINSAFLSLLNVVLQPHHASGTRETRRAMGQLVRDNLAAHFVGKPLLTPVL
jgi:lactate dehydrogenase-like 2-hydroxyacid dehydrogenase